MSIKNIGIEARKDLFQRKRSEQILGPFFALVTCIKHYNYKCGVTHASRGLIITVSPFVSRFSFWFSYLSIYTISQLKILIKKMQKVLKKGKNIDQHDI